MTVAPASADPDGPRTVSYLGADGNRLVGDLTGSGPLVVLLHGGGQTRQSWRRTATALAAAGSTALSLDLRGHGDSDWSPEGAYGMQDHARDLGAVLGQLRARPALVGASMGGVTALLALGRSPDGGAALARSLVLVDVTPKMEPAGLDRIRAFMLSAPDGFADVDDAADAVAAYLPGRSRPRSATGLLKNLRLGPDDRYRWHWDPRILDDMPSDDRARHATLSAAAAGVRVPTLLVRGGRSDVVGDDGAEEFTSLVPHAVVADVGQAGHMVAGGDNDDFTAAIVDFVRPA